MGIATSDLPLNSVLIRKLSFGNMWCSKVLKNPLKQVCGRPMNHSSHESFMISINKEIMSLNQLNLN